MRWILTGIVALSLGFLGMGCSSGTTPSQDAGTDGGIDGGTDGGVDGGTDGGVDGDNGPSVGRPTTISVTAGGGTTQSANHKARINIGAPQPMGTAEGTSHKVKTGPIPNP